MDDTAKTETAETEAAETEAGEPTTPLSNPVDLTGESISVQRLYLHLLHYRSVSRRKGVEYVFPSQVRLANELIVSSRTVKRSVARLCAMGVLRAVRTLRGNRYYFTEPGDKLAPAEGTNWPLHNETKKAEEESRDSSSSSESSAAAAAEERSKKNRPALDLLDLAAKQAEAADAETILKALGYPVAWISEGIELRGAAFVVASRAFWVWRLAHKADPIRHGRVRFLRSCFLTPTKWGYRFENGAWIAPPIEASAKAREDPEVTRAKREAERLAEKAERERSEAEANAWRERWKAAPTALRADVENAVPRGGMPEHFHEVLVLAEFRRRTEAQEVLQ